jgi:hypothetical protein
MPTDHPGPRRFRRRLRRLHLATPEEQFLDQFKGRPNGDWAFVVASPTTSDRQSPARIHPMFTDLVPLPSRKVSGDGKTVEYEGTPAVRATWWWPIAVYWALGAADHTGISIDSGVCAHYGGRWIITMMATWDWWFHGTGLIWPVSISKHRFQPHPLVPWMLMSEQQVTVPTRLATAVNRLNLPVLPLATVNDDTMSALGAEQGIRGALPLRGPHTAFDRRYGCGAGGQILASDDGSLSVINNHFTPLEHRSLLSLDRRPSIPPNQRLWHPQGRTRGLS